MKYLIASAAALATLCVGVASADLVDRTWTPIVGDAVEDGGQQVKRLSRTLSVDPKSGAFGESLHASGQALRNSSVAIGGSNIGDAIEDAGKSLSD